MRISDWSSDVCSSDLDHASGGAADADGAGDGRIDAAKVDRTIGAVERAPVDRFERAIVGSIDDRRRRRARNRSEEHTSELQSLMRISYAVFCLKKKTKTNTDILMRLKSKENYI